MFAQLFDPDKLAARCSGTPCLTNLLKRLNDVATQAYTSSGIL
jgi:hypothetical protein